PLTKALNYLAVRVNDLNEPYLIASYSLASSQAGLTDQARQANIRLKEMAHAEGPRTYWALETNTPFYGWGLAGRIETTAVVVQALSRYGMPDPLINRGLVFLLRAKDRYGVWYSTQATINVLGALLELFGHEINATSASSRTATIVVNGREVKSIELPEPQRLANVITV